MSQRILGIDVGPERSALCYLNGMEIGYRTWTENELILGVLHELSNADRVALESPQAQDRPLGKLLRDTIWWAGRFAEALDRSGVPWREVDERDVCHWLTGNRSGSNAAILQSLKDIFGDTAQKPCKECQDGMVPGVRGPKKCGICKGNKFIRVPGPLHGLNEHERSALAAAYYVQQQRERRPASA